MKYLVQLIQKAEILSAISVRLTKLTGKSAYPIHPKHLVPDKLWFEDLINSKDRVLDLGCNAGQLSFKIAEKAKEVIGLEVDDRLLSMAELALQERKRSNVSFIKGDANKKLPFKSNSFDKVFCSDVLEHLDKRNYAVSEIFRVLKKQGILLLVTDNPDTTWKKILKKNDLNHYADPDHRYEYPKHEIVRLLKKNKLSIISIEPVTYNTPLAPFIDFLGGFSLALYRRLKKWREYMNRKYPNETTGYRIVAQKI